MKASELRTAIIDIGTPERSVHIFTEELVMPSPKWITGKLAHALDDLYFDLHIIETPDQFDCSVYSLMAVAWSKPCWYKTQPRREAGLAFGFFGSLARLHALCVAARRDAKGKVQIQFYEGSPSVKAGTQAFRLVSLLPVTLTREEIATCVLCVFF